MKKDDRFEISIKRDYKVVKANEIIQKARNDLTLKELKELAYILSMVKPTDSKKELYIFNIHEYCRVCGIDFNGGKNYIDVRNSLKSIRDKSFYMLKENNKETTVGWLSKVTIDHGNGKVEVRLDEDLAKYVIGLFENFTQYELLSVLPMKSAYSFKMYELLKSYAFTGSHTFEIEELKKAVSATHYTNFKDFRVKVLEVATKEINSFTDLAISWESITHGKKVIQVKFYIKQLDGIAKINRSQRATDQLDGQLSLFDGQGADNDNVHD